MFCHAHWHTINIPQFPHISWPLSLKTLEQYSICPESLELELCRRAGCWSGEHGYCSKVLRFATTRKASGCLLTIAAGFIFCVWGVLAPFSLIRTKHISWRMCSEICRCNLKVFPCISTAMGASDTGLGARVSTVCMYIGRVVAGFFPYGLQSGVSKSAKGGGGSL